ncbi:MAG: HesB/IscA family protein [Pseudomonadota bacterium]
MLTLTDKAISAVQGIITSTSGATGLRVMVSGGGCSGYQYGMGLEAAPSAEDEVIVLEGLRVYVDPASAPLLQGVTIDYVEDISGVGFRFHNPKAVATCGCGSSFSVGDVPEGAQPSTCSQKR